MKRPDFTGLYSHWRPGGKRAEIKRITALLAALMLFLTGCGSAPGQTEATNYMEMPATLITRDILTADTTIENIYDAAPDTYGNAADFVSSDWLKECIGY